MAKLWQALGVWAFFCVLQSEAFVDPSAIRFSYRYGICPAQISGYRPQGAASFPADSGGSQPQSIRYLRHQRRLDDGKIDGLLVLAAGGGDEGSSDLLGRVKAVVAEQLGKDITKITADSSFTKDLEADSLDSVELVMAFEEKFGVTIPDEEATKITTVQEAVDYIQKHKS